MDLRKIDALVAEHVFGWKPYAPHPGEWVGPDDKYVGDTEDIRPYSSDIAAAWEVVSQLNANGIMVGLDALPDGKGVVSVLKKDEQGDWRSIQSVVPAESVSLAICLAALKAKGIAV